jgi:hypothetical protein
VKKILFIGNSHLATVKSAESSGIALADYIGFSFQPDFNFDTYENTPDGGGISAPANQRHLWDITTNSADYIDLSKYDFFFVVGLLPPPNPWLCVEDGTECETKNNFISFNVCATIFNYVFNKDINLAKYIQAVIRKNDYSRKVFFIPLPYMREDYKKVGFPGLNQPAEWSAFSKNYKSDFTLLIDQYYYRFFDSHDLNVLRLSDLLRTNGNMCPAEYSIQALGSQNFNSEKNPQWGDGDLYHKNKRYGEILWGDINNLIRNDFKKSISSCIVNEFHFIRTIHGSQLVFDESIQLVVHIINYRFESSTCPVLLWHGKNFDALFYMSNHAGLVRLGLDNNSQQLVILDEERTSNEFKIIYNQNGFGIKNLTNNYFFSATNNGTFICNREEMKTWETFSLEK